MDYETFCTHQNVPRGTFLKLQTYHQLLLKWQQRINLISPDTIEEAWTRHFLDSAQLIDHIPKDTTSLLDLGSGAGFPGLILAMMGIPNVHLVESVGKKTAFMQEVARETETKVTIHTCRIEALESTAFDVITSRALAPLSNLIKLAEPFCHQNTTCIFPKGKNYSKEIEEARTVIRASPACPTKPVGRSGKLRAMCESADEHGHNNRKCSTWNILPNRIDPQGVILITQGIENTS